MEIYKTMDNGVQIVEYDDTLAVSVADMWNKSGDSWGGDSSIMTAEQVIANYSGGSYFNIFTAVHNGEVVGVCTFNRYYKDADTTYVQLLNVRPDYHGRKVGKELVLSCINRTIELGYPRVDINTWPGNTKAVPLYKKCGFLWEDRADTTHLSNFIPTVLKTELFSEFFKTADWYKDSSRIIEIKPDGVKVSKFEFYGYSWKKNDKNLTVGFEKTGRRVRYVETDDYTIVFLAENHELAFGLNYKCTFKVLNKSGKELHIKIVGKTDDKGIKFDYQTEDDVNDVGKVGEFDAEFYVEPIKEEIDIGRMHPCVLADVYINGKHAEFGLGIEPKFPLDVRFVEKRHAIAKPGMIQDVYINVKSALLKKASVIFNIPASNMTRFIDDSFAVNVESGMTSMLSAKAETLNCGYEKLNINYSVTLDDGQKINFSKPLHLINQGLDVKFSYETDYEYCAVNGLCKLSLNKQNNFIYFYRTAGNGNACFPIPKLGKPYTDEFNLAKPSDVRIYYSGESSTVLEADYESNNFNGIVLTEINEFNASGVISHRHKITNHSQQPMPLYLTEDLWTSVGRRSVFHYDGEIHEVNDNTAYGLSDMRDEKLLDENWIFDNSVSGKSGMYWDKEYKPHLKWGAALSLEYNIGGLAPDAIFETKPSVYMSGIFNNVREFRNYVLGINEETNPYFVLPIDIKLNGRNPFIDTETDNIELTVKNNRLKIYGGSIKFSSPDKLFDETIQVNPEREIKEINVFNSSINKKIPGIYMTEIDFNFQGWEKTHKRALFVADKSAKVVTDEKDGVYTVTNGKLCYKSSPAYSDAVYSMKYGENEWLFSKYPDREPYVWWNPFIGGIQAQLWNMSNALTLREKIIGEFVTVKDNFETEWTGIKTTVEISEFAEHKGVTYEQFYVTKPSLPVLCYFVRLIDNTGGYKDIGYNMDAVLSGKENLTDIYARTQTWEKEEYLVKMGCDSWWDSNKFLRISREGKSAWNEKLYVFTDHERNNGGLGVGGDINVCHIHAGAGTNLIDNASRTMRPVFFILTEKELTLDSVTDLDRVTF
ncbi:MAG: GNAT family N-acetyltransferase [Oscillospiraceae bacterium]|nr:GNAT family N-acetyltransferase [Oscillospiraceae bacterium]